MIETNIEEKGFKEIFKERVLNKRFGFIVLSIILFFALYLHKIQIFGFDFIIVSLFLIALAQVLYIKKFGSKGWLNKIIDFISILTVIVALMVYLIAYVGTFFALAIELNVALVLILISTLFFALTTMILIPVILSGKIIWRAKNVTDVILEYPIIAISTILFFSSIFIITNLIPGFGITQIQNGSMVVSNISASDTSSFIWFSGTIFYSNTFGDMSPIGYSKALVISELIASSVIHVIVLGHILGKLDKTKDVDEKFKN